MTTTDTKPALPTIDAATVKAALTAAVAAYNAAPVAGPAYGCGRVYVAVRGVDRKTFNAVAKTCKAMGLMWLPEAYGTSGKVIYLGYDNGTGGPLAKGEAFAAALTTFGIGAYMDAVAD